MLLLSGFDKPHNPVSCVPRPHPVPADKIAKAKAVLRLDVTAFSGLATCLNLCHATYIRPGLVYLCPDTKVGDAKFINFNSKLMDYMFAGFLLFGNPRESFNILPIAVIGYDMVSVCVRVS